MKARTVGETEASGGDPPTEDAAAWDRRFQPGGEWERNGGRRQTRVYAQAFCSRVTFPRNEAFSLLDVGCALGEALLFLHRRYPQARFYGTDLSSLAAARAQEALGAAATCFASDGMAVRDHYDVIYTSHVLEHFPDYQGVARHLLARCARLCIVVPFEERVEGRPLQPGSHRQHERSFSRESFDFLVQEGRARRVSVHLVCCPGARRLRKALFRPIAN